MILRSACCSGQLIGKGVLATFKKAQTVKHRLNASVKATDRGNRNLTGLNSNPYIAETAFTCYLRLYKKNKDIKQLQ